MKKTELEKYIKDITKVSKDIIFYKNINEFKRDVKINRDVIFIELKEITNLDDKEITKTINNIEKEFYLNNKRYLNNRNGIDNKEEGFKAISGITTTDSNIYKRELKGKRIEELTASQNQDKEELENNGYLYRNINGAIMFFNERIEERQNREELEKNIKENSFLYSSVIFGVKFSYIIDIYKYLEENEDFENKFKDIENYYIRTMKEQGTKKESKRENRKKLEECKDRIIEELKVDIDRIISL